MLSNKLALVVIALLAVSCCSAKATKNDSSSTTSVKVEKAVAEKTVYFEYNSFDLTSDAKEILDEKVLPVAKENTSLKLKVEGHCDERGSVAYNEKLGKKRADAVKKYLVEKGVKSDKIRTVSYGKSRPVDFGHNESAWAKNRRAVTIEMKK